MEEIQPPLIPTLSQRKETDRKFCRQPPAVIEETAPCWRRAFSSTDAPCHTIQLNPPAPVSAHPYPHRSARCRHAKYGALLPSLPACVRCSVAIPPQTAAHHAKYTDAKTNSLPRHIQPQRREQHRRLLLGLLVNTNLSRYCCHITTSLLPPLYVF